MNFFSVFPDKAKIANFSWKDTDVRRTEVVCHVISTFLDFGFTLGEE